jgi:hypothetical protein
MKHRRQSVSETVQKCQVYEHPDHPSRKSAEADLVDAGDGAKPANCCNTSEIPVLEGDTLLALQAAQDGVRGVKATLHGDLCDTGKVSKSSHVTNGKDVRMTAHGEIGFDRDATGVIDGDTASLSQFCR